MDKKRRKKNFNVVANDGRDNEEIFENFEKLTKEMSNKDIDFIINSLKENFLFKNLKDTEFEVIIQNMFLARVKKGEYIF